MSKEGERRCGVESATLFVLLLSAAAAVSRFEKQKLIYTSGRAVCFGLTDYQSILVSRSDENELQASTPSYRKTKLSLTRIKD